MERHILLEILIANVRRVISVVCLKLVYFSRISFISVQQLASSDERYPQRRLRVQLVEDFVDSCPGRAELLGHHSVTRDEYAIFVVSRVCQVY